MKRVRVTLGCFGNSSQQKRTNAGKRYEAPQSRACSPAFAAACFASSAV